MIIMKIMHDGLWHAMSMKANQQFNIELFTQKDAFEKYLRDGSPTVAMDERVRILMME